MDRSNFWEKNLLVDRGLSQASFSLCLFFCFLGQRLYHFDTMLGFIFRILKLTVLTNICCYRLTNVFTDIFDTNILMWMASDVLLTCIIYVWYVWINVNDIIVSDQRAGHEDAERVDLNILRAVTIRTKTMWWRDGIWIPKGSMSFWRISNLICRWISM